MEAVTVIRDGVAKIVPEALAETFEKDGYTVAREEQTAPPVAAKPTKKKVPAKKKAEDGEEG